VFERYEIDAEPQGAAMRSFSEISIWTCAGLYMAAGLIGVFLLGAQLNDANSTDGYGLIRVVAATAAPAAHP
jgi:hypothetical protein